MAHLTMRDLEKVRLVCNEWMRTIDGHLRNAAHRYCILPGYAMDYYIGRLKYARFNLCTDSAWMVDMITTTSPVVA